MSHLLWKSYWEDDVDRFRRLLAPAGYTAQAASRSPNIGAGSASPGAIGTSPRTVAKPRKSSGYGIASGAARHGGTSLGKGDLNSRDHAGLTILLRAASSTSASSLSFIKILLEHPAVDIYAVDPENGWNALHRALYAGNISIARLLLEKERKNITGQTVGASNTRVGQLIKTKDHEGNSPFDVYNSTIGTRDLGIYDESRSELGSENDDMPSSANELGSASNVPPTIEGEELFTFGSNKNLSLGLGDEDDRQFPERVYLKRPDHLLQRFYAEHLEESGLDYSSSSVPDLANIPTTILNRPLLIQDVALSKFHSAIITKDPVSNLYVCGIGPGGRLGLSDESTRFSFVPVQGPLMDKKVTQVALGHNHTMAVTSNGELWTWGSNATSQLGYPLPPPKNDEDPHSTTPRQVFGPLKKESIIGVAASSVHSVAHTGTSLYCWGKNLGQLALMDADSRSLEVQPIPRRVAASLFSSSIVMVSAIDKATTCLLSNATVCVFTGYGYNIIKFPFADVRGNLGSLHMMHSQNEAAQTEIQYVASGGETIAALSGRGDLFTMNLNHKIDANPAATSTTNPSKIRNAVTQPQCIWNARQDGVRSVGVGEHGSVIIRTTSGAVWRRVKRAKAKDTTAHGRAETKKADYKFQRVPYVTDVVTVRSSAFGAFAAIRRDSDVMRTQIKVDRPSLWDDIGSLCCLEGFTASEITSEHRANFAPRMWDTLEERLGSVAYHVIKSPDIEADLQHHLTSLRHRGGDYDVILCTSSSPELLIPVHGWVLVARSPTLRDILKRHRHRRMADVFDGPDFLKVEVSDDKVRITFTGLDVVSILNMVLYMYKDALIPVWNFTRQASALAYRYRQIRSELMRVATHLKMVNFEAAVRVQTNPKRSMADDFRDAIRNRSFFEDGDAVVELDGGELPVHSALVCQRCPWFEGLFHGRSGGLWLADRRHADETTERVTIDLKHIEPRIFRYVIDYLYADSGPEMFDTVILPDFDDLIDLVMDVLSVANELMLDRLSQICQQVLGRYVNSRSIAHLLNAVGPCSVTEFKIAGLEYVCLQMECMLENHLLDELDQELLLDLDAAVRENQLAQCPYARSDRADGLLHEKYPLLAEDIQEERQRRVKEMAFKAIQREDERRLSSSFKSKVGSLDELTAMSPTTERTRRPSRVARNEPFSPDLRPKDSHAELMFDMEEGEESSTLNSPLVRPSRHVEGGSAADVSQLPSLSEPWSPGKERDLAKRTRPPPDSPALVAQDRPAATPPQSPPNLSSPGSKNSNPWGQGGFPTSKLDLRQIMTESTPASSALSAGLAAQKSKDASGRPTPAKISQKERKKQQQQQQLTASPSAEPKSDSPAAWETVSPAARPSPWRKTPSGPKTSLKEVMSQPAGTAPLPPAKPLVAAEASSKTIPRRTASPDTRFSGQARTPVAPAGASRSHPAAAANPGLLPSPASPSSSRPLIPHSKSYLPPRSKAEPALGLAMDDIIGQQQREREIVREAVAKRSLQEIQQEQAFQEWWDQESRRTQEEEEARRVAREREREREREGEGKGGKGKEKGKGKGKADHSSRRGRPGRPKGDAQGGGSAGGSAGPVGSEGGKERPKK